MTKRACYDGDEEEDRLVISEDQGEDSLGEDFVDSFKGDSVSMVQVSTHSPIDYNQMEQYLDATGKVGRLLKQG
jgi:hypothetical protein